MNGAKASAPMSTTEPRRSPADEIRIRCAHVALSRRSLCRACVVGAASGASIVAGTSAVAAEEGRPPEAIRLQFEVEGVLVSQCPDRSRFVELLRRERPRLSLATEDATARTLSVRILRGPRGALAGEVGVTDVDGATHTRSVSARDCRTLVRALSVVAAVATDLVSDAEEPPVTPRAEAPKPASPPPPRSAPSSATSRPRPSPSTPPPRPAKAPSMAVHLGAGTELVLGALPRPAMGYRAYVDAQRSSGVLDGAFRASFAFARAQLPGTSRMNVFVQTWTARFEGCAGRRLATAFSAEACLGATAGAYHSYSAGITGARDDVRPWLTLGGGLRARWHVRAAIFAELFGSASHVSTVYDTVARDHTAASHVVPRVVGEIGLGLGHSFAVP